MAVLFAMRNGSMGGNPSDPSGYLPCKAEVFSFLCCDGFEIRRNGLADFRIRKPARAFRKHMRDI